MIQHDDPWQSAQCFAPYPLINKNSLVQVPSGCFSPWTIFIWVLDVFGISFTMIHLTYTKDYNVEYFPHVFNIYKFFHIEGSIKLKVPLATGSDIDRGVKGYGM